MMWMTYIIIFLFLLILELTYFKVADKCNIIDKPNERSSHSTIVLRGGGIIFAISMIIWAIIVMVQEAQGIQTVQEYLPFLCGLVLIAGVSFWDDVKSLPDSVRLVAQFVAMALMFWNMGLFSVESLGFSVESQWLSILLMVLIVVAAAIDIAAAIVADVADMAATTVFMEAVVGWWCVEGVVVSRPSGKAKGGVPGALQFEAHPRVRAVGLGPVFGKPPYHFLSVALGEGLECVDEALASLFEPFLVTFCRNLLAHARVCG